MTAVVTGVAGVAGFNAFNTLHRKYPGQVIGIRPHQTWKLVGPGLIAQDADAHAALRHGAHLFGADSSTR